MPARYYRKLSPEARAGRLTQCRAARAELSNHVRLSCGCIAHRIARTIVQPCEEHKGEA